MLLAGFGAGDPTLSVRFVRRFQSVIFGVALSVLGDRTVAEDVAQRTFEQAWRHAATFDSRRGSVHVWLAGIARHEAIDTARRSSPTPTDPLVLADLLGDERGGAAAGDPRWIAAAAPLRSALRTLPVEQARAVVLAGVHGYTAREIADHERVPVGTAKTRLRTAMGRLRERLAEPSGEPTPEAHRP